MLASVTLRLGSLQEALTTAPTAQVLLAWLALPVLAYAGLYRSVLRYLDLRVIVQASSALAVVVLLVYGLAQAADVGMLPRSSILMFWFIALAYVLISRFVVRAMLWGAMKRPGLQHQRTAIYGAGAAGAQLAQSMRYSPEYRAACFIDDSRMLQGKQVVGLTVYSPEEFARYAERLGIDQVVVAVPSAGPQVRQQIMRRAGVAGLPVKTLPGLVELVSGQVHVSDIREVDVADLLGRAPVPPDASLFSRNITGKNVLVTGAGGSIGSELCRQIMSQGPSKLVLLDHSEFALYSIDQELSAVRRATLLMPVLGTVLDRRLLDELLRGHNIHTVYHAAAYKHVPLVEANVRKGIENNVLGTHHVAQAAAEAGVETCVLVSTDKAVRPTNVMGATKRAAELVFQAASRQRDRRTTFAMVRFGNVLGSSGSVVPLFKRQIREGGPITITHQDIIRFFMLIPEAAQLVIQAGAMAKGGEVFVLDMGEPVRIVDLARSLIRLSGLMERTDACPEGDIEIKFVGLRPGEKLYEELLIGDGVVPSEHPRILCAHERFLEPAELEPLLQSLRRYCCGEADVPAMIRCLQQLVPEYVPDAQWGLADTTEPAIAAECL